MSGIIVDKDWVDSLKRETSTEPLLVDTSFWVDGFFRDQNVIRWMRGIGIGHLIVTHTTIRELMFAAHWQANDTRTDADFDSRLLEFADAIHRAHPYLPLSDPGLISTIEHLRADPRLKKLWITDLDNALPMSPGRLEMAAASTYLGIAIASSVNGAYKLIAECGYRLPKVFDSITGEVIILDGKVLK